MHRNMLGWELAYAVRYAFWFHDENLGKPHVVLPSGQHSNGYFNTRLIIPHDVVLGDAASDLLELLSSTGEAEGTLIDMVVGPQTGATRLAELISFRVPTYTGDPCGWSSPAKVETNGIKSMVFTPADVKRLNGNRVLLCEDVITTGKSVDLAARAVIAAGGTVLPFVLALVNRSGLTEINGRRVVSLISRLMPLWDPEDCPLCKAGSKAITAGKDNWNELNLA